MHYVVVLFALALFAPTLAQEDIKIDNFDRNVAIISVKPLPATIADILDPNHQNWIASGFNTTAEIHNFDINVANAYFISQFGYDFYAAGVVVSAATGTRTILKDGAPLVTWVPYKFELPSYRITMDSEDKQKSREFWHVINYGVIAQFAQAGKFPAGCVAAGLDYYPFDIISRNRYHFVKQGANWLDPRFNERFDIFSEYVGRQTPNAHSTVVGFIPSHTTVITEKIIDSRGNVGCSTITTTTFPTYGNVSDTYTTINHLSRWPCKGLNRIELNKKRGYFDEVKEKRSTLALTQAENDLVLTGF